MPVRSLQYGSQATRHPLNRGESRTAADAVFHLIRQSNVRRSPHVAEGPKEGCEVVSPEQCHRSSLATRVNTCVSALQSAASLRAKFASPRASWRSKHNTSAARSARIPAQLRQRVDWLGLVSGTLASQTIRISVLSGQF